MQSFWDTFWAMVLCVFWGVFRESLEAPLPPAGSFWEESMHPGLPRGRLWESLGGAHGPEKHTKMIPIFDPPKGKPYYLKWGFKIDLKRI